MQNDCNFESHMYIFYQHEVYLQITEINEMTHHHVNTIQNHSHPPARQEKTSWCLNSVNYCEAVYCSCLFVRLKLCLPLQRKTRSFCHCFVISGSSHKTSFACKYKKLIYGEKRKANIFENCTCQQVNNAKNIEDKQRSP